MQRASEMRTGPNCDWERRTQSSSATRATLKSGAASAAARAADETSTAGSVPAAASAVTRVRSLPRPHQFVAYPGLSKDRLLGFSSCCGIAHIDGQGPRGQQCVDHRIRLAGGNFKTN
jgi:hypothetical protein